MQRPYAPPGATSDDDDDDDIQFMVNVVPIIRIDFPCFLSRLPSAVSPKKQQQIGFRNNNSFQAFNN